MLSRPHWRAAKATWELGEALNFIQLHITSEPRFSWVYHEDTVPTKLRRANTRESLCEGQKIMFTIKWRMIGLPGPHLKRYVPRRVFISRPPNL